ncbi:nuclear receptor coactivator 5 [Megalops cyprinoides]|uniref:nuclear receptor coactivator 5 n=1 Tax=Megalops cyprinoides TaxID=118141 RepID=UPI0018643727|nr:nuclear receptor coactivator 5 [Megalops cyprinoides]
MSRRRSRSGSPSHHTTNSNDPRDLERRIFVGNLPTTLMDRKDMEDLFSSYGKIHALSMFRGYGFVQFERAEEAEAAKAGQNGRFYRGYKLDVNMAAERRQNKAQSRQSPPRRNPYGGYGDGREPRTRSRSPMHARDSRDHRDTRDMREPGREPRPGHPRDHDPRDPNFDRYREGRDKDPRGDPRDQGFRDEGYDRYYRMDDYYRKKEDPYMDRYRDPWNGRREPEDDRPRVEERRRNELYRQYYEELQRRYDSERPVDCSVIVVNKQQKEYAETVGRKVRDLGMVVDLIFLNTEVSLTQALEDVGRARTPFAIIITQQHQVHRSCTVNILFGTPQEHRNMPMQDAMVLVAHNYDLFKAEHRDKEREEIARKAAKMADDVLMREHEREGHPISLQPAITLLAEGRYLTLEELDGLIDYLRDKRERMIRASGDPHAGSHPPPSAAGLEAPPPAQTLPTASLATHAAHPTQATHLPPPPASNPVPPSNHQQELQAKILSLFNSGAGAPPTSSGVPPPAQGGYSSPMGSQTAGMPPAPALAPSAIPKMPPASAQGPGMMSARPALRPPSMVPPQGPQRPAATGTGINFDNPSVQKALDTLIQSGPSINHLVNPGSSPAPRPGQGMGQPPPMAHYPRHY